MDQSQNQNNYISKISIEEVNDLKRHHFQGQVHIIEHPDQLIPHLYYLHEQSILGFDTETRPSFKKGVNYPVALLQLATADQAFLIRLNKMDLPESIIQIFEDPLVFKIGAAIRDDIKSLKKLRDFTPQSFIDLQDYVEGFGIESKSLKKLAGIILNIRISKSQRVSNWENPVLTENQKQYAATDAWVCYEIYQKLEKTRDHNE